MYTRVFPNLANPTGMFVASGATSLVAPSNPLRAHLVLQGNGACDAKATNAPLTPARAREGKKRRDWRPAFLEGFRRSGTVAGGCKAADVARTTAYRERQRNESFALKWADIEADVTEALEQTALHLALRGEARLIEFLLRARKPDMYRDRHVLEHHAKLASSSSCSGRASPICTGTAMSSNIRAPRGAPSNWCSLASTCRSSTTGSYAFFSDW
jgi:hypothetical protein